MAVKAAEQLWNGRADWVRAGTSFQGESAEGEVRCTTGEGAAADKDGRFGSG